MRTFIIARSYQQSAVSKKKNLVQCVQHFFTYIVASKTVIPAEAGIQKGKQTGFRVKPGMTIKVKSSGGFQ